MRQLAKKLATKMGSLWEDMADMDGESKVGGAVEVACCQAIKQSAVYK